MIIEGRVFSLWVCGGGVPWMDAMLWSVREERQLYSHNQCVQYMCTHSRGHNIDMNRARILAWVSTLHGFPTVASIFLDKSNFCASSYISSVGQGLERQYIFEAKNLTKNFFFWSSRLYALNDNVLPSVVESAPKMHRILKFNELHLILSCTHILLKNLPPSSFMCKT